MDSIGFVLTNFIEMNKLWVRLQHSGLSRDKERRELERRELRILVGTNLVRLSQLEGVDLELYKSIILPSVLEQVVNCKDVIAQEYLMEVVIQVFTDDFHLRTLSPFLSATAQLHPKVNIKSIVIALIDRLASFAAREAENESPEIRAREEEEQAKKLLKEVRKQRERTRVEKEAKELNQKFGKVALEPEQEEETEGWGAAVNFAPPGAQGLNGNQEDDGKIDGHTPREIGEGTGKKYRGIPQDVKLFEVFWAQVVNLIKARPDLSLQDITALLVSLANLSLSCYPSHLSYIDQVLSFALSQTELHQSSSASSASTSDLYHPTTTSNLLALLLAPIQNYLTVLTLLALPNYSKLLRSQPFQTRKSISHAIVANVLRNETVIDTKEDVEGILELCHVLVRDQKDRPVGPHSGSRSGAGMDRSLSGGGVSGGYIPQFGQGGVGTYGSAAQHLQQQQLLRGGAGYDREEMAEEQGWIARMVHLFRSDDLDIQFSLLETARREFSEGGDRIRWTFPPLIVSAIKLSRRYKQMQLTMDPTTWDSKVSTLFRFIHQATSILYNKVESSSDICLRLYLLSLSAADETGLEELAYEFAVQAFTIYEESISESRAQLQAIVTIISTLQVTRVFGEDNYDTLITKAALHGAKLLKKGQQATAVALASHLWWQTESVPGRVPSEEDKPPYRDGKRVLECLQKALRIATSSIDELTSVQLYCDALDQYLYYFERGVDAISAKHINSLVELITSNLDSLPPSNPATAPPQPGQFERHSAPSTSGGATSGLIEGSNTRESVLNHFRNSLLYIQGRKLGRGNGLPPTSTTNSLSSSSEEDGDHELEGGMTSRGGGGGGRGEMEQIQRLYRDVDVQGVLLKLGVNP